MHRSFIYLLFCLCLLVTGCSGTLTKVDSKSTSSVYPEPMYPSSEQSYPYPSVATVPSVYPYPLPMATEPTYFATLGPVPTPGTDWGVVTGRLFMNKKAMSNAKLYLADLSKDDKGTETIASYSASSSPWAYSDENGNFAFSQIPPGRYSLVYYFVVDSFLLNEPGEDKSLILTVESGKVTDLGDLYYTDLPTIP